MPPPKAEQTPTPKPGALPSPSDLHHFKMLCTCGETTQVKRSRVFALPNSNYLLPWLRPTSLNCSCESVRNFLGNPGNKQPDKQNQSPWPPRRRLIKCFGQVNILDLLLPLDEKKLSFILLGPWRLLFYHISWKCHKSSGTERGHSYADSSQHTHSTTAGAWSHQRVIAWDTNLVNLF